MAQIVTEDGLVHYGFSLSADGTICHVREGYKNAEALLAHMANVGPILGKAKEAW